MAVSDLLLHDPGMYIAVLYPSLYQALTTDSEECFQVGWVTGGSCIGKPY